jgi:hypothetical protein
MYYLLKNPLQFFILDLVLDSAKVYGCGNRKLRLLILIVSSILVLKIIHKRNVLENFKNILVIITITITIITYQ